MVCKLLRKPNQGSKTKDGTIELWHLTGVRRYLNNYTYGLPLPPAEVNMTSFYFGGTSSFNFDPLEDSRLTGFNLMIASFASIDPVLNLKIFVIRRSV